MAKLIRYLLLGITALPGLSFAQKATLINSTEQYWSGGIAGRHGCNYTFTIDIIGKAGDIIADTIWIGDKPVTLSQDDGQGGGDGRRKVTAIKNKVRYDITAGTGFDDYEDGFPRNMGGKGQNKQLKPPVKYAGVALLSYKYNGSRRYFAVTKIMKKDPAQSYP